MPAPVTFTRLYTNHAGPEYAAKSVQDNLSTGDAA
jgi:hypothetical protein